MTPESDFIMTLAIWSRDEVGVSTESVFQLALVLELKILMHAYQPNYQLQLTSSSRDLKLFWRRGQNDFKMTSTLAWL